MFLNRGSDRTILPASVRIVLWLVMLTMLHLGAPSNAQWTSNNRVGGDVTATYVGSQACSQCHGAEHRDWLGSHHAAAMQPATEKTVLGRFDGATFSKDGVETRFFKSGGKFWVRTDGPDGKIADFEIKHTFGITPLQQYLIELPGGRLQAFGIAWDSRPEAEGGQRWYHLYPDRKLTPGDPLHWTGVDQNWNYQCAWCHSTNLRKNYDQKTRTFKTEWSEINVGCEACHGPASKHLGWSAKPANERSTEPGAGFGLRFDQRKDAGWRIGPTGQAARSVTMSSSKEIRVCASCHGRRGQFSDAPSDVARFFDAFRASRLEPGLYHVDGQQRDEVFNYGSFVQSRMHAAGVTCSDCHNPHSGKLHQTGNAVCAQCHAQDRFDTAAHHHHRVGSSGAQCASCHMPTTVYMGVDARHDHSMRIPRPDRSRLLGTPNACNQCHTDKTAQWAMEEIKTWYPAPKPGAQSFAEAFELGDIGAPGAQSALIRIIEDSSLSGLVRASAIARLGRYPSRQVLAVISDALKIDDPDVRSAAIAAMAPADAQTRRSLIVPLLRDRSRLIRMDAAREIAGEIEQRLSADEKADFERALTEYEEAQRFSAERPESQANLGALYLRRGLLDQAKSAFREALELDRTFIVAAVALADVARAEGDESTCESILRGSLQSNPRSGPLLHALGLSLVRQKRLPEALEKLAEATQLTPEDPRFAYVYAIALNGSGRRADAVGVLKSAVARHYYDRNLLLTLLSWEIEARDLTSALARAELLVRLEPERTDIHQLVIGFKGGLR